jgi:hypothetical protein
MHLAEGLPMHLLDRIGHVGGPSFRNSFATTKAGEFSKSSRQPTEHPSEYGYMSQFMNYSFSKILQGWLKRQENPVVTMNLL